MFPNTPLFSIQDLSCKTGSRANINCNGNISLGSENAIVDNRGWQVNLNVLSGTLSIGGGGFATIKQDTRVVVDGGALFLREPTRLETGVGIYYISGTISGSPRLMLVPTYRPRYGTNFRKPAYYFNTPGHTWGEIVINNVDNNNTFPTYSITFLSDFNSKRFFINDTQVANSQYFREYELVATQSVNVNLGDFLTNYIPFNADGNSPFNSYQKWYFSAHTFSFNRFCMIGKNFGEYSDFPPIFPPASDVRNGPQFQLTGLDTGATINLLNNESYALGVSFSNINVVGNNLYAFGSTWSNSTGILGAFPTGGGGGGATAAETSYAYIA